MANIFGRYQLKHEIGSGGMSTVYLATDPRLDRDVAIKVLPLAFVSEPDLRSRFIRESRTIGALGHPAIVPIYDYDEHDGQPYLVMRYMIGGSMSTRIADSGAFSLQDTVAILEPLADALDTVHERGIVHRDLKPGNILFDQYDNPFLCDFGIVKVIDDHGTVLKKSTMVGTPAYICPEQAQGKQVTRTADIYSLGVVLFEMLTGHQPYSADSYYALAHMHIHDPIPLMDAYAPHLPLECQTIVEKAMAKHPTDRYATAGQLIAALKKIPEQPTVPEKSSIKRSENTARSKKKSTPPPIIGWRPLGVDSVDIAADDTTRSAGYEWKQLDTDE